MTPELEAEVSRWRAAYGTASRPVVVAIQKLISEGKKVTYNAVQRIVGEAALASWIVSETTKSAYIAAGVGIAQAGVTGVSLAIDELKFKSWYTTKKFKRSNFRLSRRVTTAKVASTIYREVKRGIDTGETVFKLTRDIQKAVEFKPDEVPQAIRRLQRYVQRGDVRSLAGDRLAREIGARAVALERDTASKGRLRSAYTQLAMAVKTGTGDIIRKATEKAVSEKARYQAERIVRTEFARSYSMGMREMQEADSDVVGWKWTLSASHKIFDICDMHASADLYGMGAGVYPVDAGPNYPAHPNCKCLQRTVYKGESKGFSDKKAISFIKRLPKSKRQALLGVAGEKKFSRDPKSYAEFLKNYDGQPGRVDRIPKKIIKKLTDVN